MKNFNEIMALLVFVLSIACLATTPYNDASYSTIDYVLAWMGVVCFSTYFMRDMLRKLGKKSIDFTFKSIKVRQ